MITKISLENFKKFQNVSLELSPFTVLMGENGCGKTSLLQAVALGLRMLSTADFVTYNPTIPKPIRFRRRGIPYTQLPGLYIEDPKDLFYGKRSRGGTGGGTTPIKVELIDTNNNTYKIEIQHLFGSYNAKCTSNESDITSNPELITNYPLFISGFIGITASEERFFPFVIQDRLARGRASEILRNLLLEIFEEDPARFLRLKDKVKQNFDFEIGDVAFSREKDINVHASYKESLGKEIFDLDLSTAGSGFLQVLQILVPIYRYSTPSRVVLLDEPDAHLHPNLQRTIARVIQEIAKEENLQIIISTHSTAIIREVEPGSVIPVTNKKNILKGLSSSKEKDEIDLRLDNYVAAKASIAGKLVFVEDTEKDLLQHIDNIIGRDYLKVSLLCL